MSVPPRLRKVLRLMEHMLAFAGVCFIVYHLCFELTVMVSGSMSPALRGESYAEGDRVLMEKVSLRFRAPRRWEIYCYYDVEGTPVAKRIVGLPGEKISMRDNKIFINGVEIQKPESVRSLKYYAIGSLAASRTVDCGNGYFVLGDDSQDSYDSRYTGPVAPDRFRGRAWCILWPSDHAGLVK